MHARAHARTHARTHTPGCPPPKKACKQDDWRYITSRLALGPSAGAFIGRKIAAYAGVLYGEDLIDHQELQKVLADFRAKGYFGKRVRVQ